MSLRRFLAIAVLQSVSGLAHACLFASSTPPEGWYQWSKGLFAGDVTAVEKDSQKPLDIITVRVVEAYKGPDASLGTLTLRISNRYWKNCRVELPAAGARVLVAINPSDDAMLVPLSASYAEQLKAARPGREPAAPR
jgi:hypothetical protein